MHEQCETCEKKHIPRLITVLYLHFRKHTLRKHSNDEEKPSLPTASSRELRVVTEVVSVVLRLEGSGFEFYR